MRQAARSHLVVRQRMRSGAGTLRRASRPLRTPPFSFPTNAAVVIATPAPRGDDAATSLPRMCVMRQRLLALLCAALYAAASPSRADEMRPAAPDATCLDA